MSKVGTKIPKKYKIILYTLLLISLISGSTFFIMFNWIEVEGDFGPQKHPWQYFFLQLHGAAAFLMMISFGFLLGTHVPAGWKTKKLRKTGITLVSSIIYLIISAYFLYYIAQEDFRKYLGWSHAIVGISLPFQIAFHLFLGHRKKKRSA